MRYKLILGAEGEKKKKWKKIFQVLKLGLTNFHLICFVSRRILRWTRLKKVNAVSKEDFSHCDLRYIMNKWGKVDKEFDEREREREGKKFLKLSSTDFY